MSGHNGSAARSPEFVSIDNNNLAFDTPRGGAWPGGAQAAWKVRLADHEPNNAKIHSVSLRHIDHGDHRFQCRFSFSSGDLVDSLQRHGQQTPVILWGGIPPFKVIDGFRRIEALRALQRPSVLAVLRPDLGEAEAFLLSFSENVRRKNLDTLDRAGAIWQAVHTWGLAKEDVAEIFSLSIRQIDRYLSLLDFPIGVLEAVKGRRISMAHAVRLRQACVVNTETWIQTIAAESLSARELARRLSKRRRRPKRYLVRQARGFQLKAIRYRANLPAAEKERILEALRAAIELIQGEA